MIVRNHLVKMDAEVIALHALVKERVVAMEDELNIDKSEVTVIWSKLTTLLELVKLRDKEAKRRKRQRIKS